jgi:hypothetical protein
MFQYLGYQRRQPPVQFRRLGHDTSAGTSSARTSVRGEAAVLDLLDPLCRLAGRAGRVLVAHRAPSEVTITPRRRDGAGRCAAVTGPVSIDTSNRRWSAPLPGADSEHWRADASHLSSRTAGSAR